MESVMSCNMSAVHSHKMPEGLKLEISEHPLTMKRVANIIIALERMKGHKEEHVQGTGFRDENLLNILFENILQEEVFYVESAPPQYNKAEEHEYNITDSEKRGLVLVRDSMELHAVLLQGGVEDQKVRLNMSTYVDSQPKAEARTVALGIKNTNLFLSCRKDGDEPTLHLEEVEDRSALSGISSDDELKRFLFYKQINGVNLSTLTSVPFQDWYISTALEDSRPLEMCQSTAQRHLNFHMEPAAGSA